MADNKKTIVVSIVAVVLFIAMITAVSYAFYTSQTKTKSEDVGISNITATVETTLNEDNVINIENMIPGDSFTKTFSITNNKGPDLYYYISVLDLENNFINKDDITYVLTENDKEIGKGTFPKTQDNANLSTNKITLPSGQTSTYKVTITYQNTDKDQKDDMNKTISGKIFIKGIS